MILKELNRKHTWPVLYEFSNFEQSGYELRRPAADFLRDGIYELRANAAGFTTGILYFFQGKNVACMTHGFTKEGAVPDTEIARAMHAKELVESNRDRYTMVWELLTWSKKAEREISATLSGPSLLPIPN